MLLRTRRRFVILYWLFQFSATLLHTQDLQLLRLISPGSRVVAGMLRARFPDQPSSMLFVTRNNEIDHKDFLALTGGDVSLVIDQTIFIANAGRDGLLSEHTLLVSGHFDRDALFRMADGGSANRESYRGVPILAVPPFARERDLFRELRWLAILDGRIAVFGSVAGVQEVLNRWIENRPTAPWLLERLEMLGHRYESWCLLPALGKNGVMEGVFASLDARLAAVASSEDPIEYGFHFGRKIEVAVSASTPERASAAEVDRPAEAIAGQHFAPPSNAAASETTERIVVKVSQRKYRDWLVECERRKLGVD